jgi:hypothetical protein
MKVMTTSHLVIPGAPYLLLCLPPHLQAVQQEHLNLKPYWQQANDGAKYHMCLCLRANLQDNPVDDYYTGWRSYS